MRETLMKITIQILVEDETTQEAAAPKILSFERHYETLRPETLGLKLDEAKTILAEVQTALVTAQATQELSHHGDCPDCGKPYPKNGTHQLTFRTLFGTMKLVSQRFSPCSCPQARMRRHGQKHFSWSPLAQCLPERTAPEFAYLQTKWAAIMSYGRAASLLEEVLPLEKRISTAVLSRQVQRVATRIDSELGEEQWAFIEGCQQEWEALPEPAEPTLWGLTAGISTLGRGRTAKQARLKSSLAKVRRENSPQALRVRE